MDLNLANLDGIEASYAHPKTNKSKFDLSLEIIPSDNEFKLTFEYCTKLFDENFIINFAKRYESILNEILIHPDTLISNISILDEDEKHKILYEFNNTKSDYPKDKTIIQLFEEQVNKTPDNIAVVFEDKKLTYRELNEKANALAYALKSMNINHKDIVSVLLDKSLEMIVSILSILKIGACYLPIDINYPKDRIDYIIGNSLSKIALSTKNITDNLSISLPILCVDLDDKSIYNNSSNFVNIESTSPEDTAYIMYTSGSTGKPKGVMVKNINVVRLVKNTNFIKFSEHERILQTGSIVFDACTFEIWSALLNGFELYIIKKEQLLDSSLLQDYLIKNRITILWLTAPLFNQLSENNPNMFNHVKYLLTGGDVLSPKHINTVRKINPNLTIINGYGPTENTTFSTCFSVLQTYEDSIPIGKPIANSTAYVVSPHGSLLPIGFAGELWVGGDGVSKGYLGNPELTSEKFIKNPFGEGIVYKTGDLVKWLPDGNIDFIGRIDNQVKIRGFRVELNEINNTISNFNNIKECTTIILDIQNKKTICSYFASNDGNKVNENELRNYLKNYLPNYMIPTYICQLEKLPINTNGKIDKNSLPKPNLTLNAENYIAPSSNLEIQIVEAFERLLSISPIGVNDNFFELGGDSLLAINLQIELMKLNLKITYSDIFMYPTVKELANKLSSGGSSTFETIDASEFAKFDKILDNTTNLPKKISKQEIGNVIITGTTGFLGSHILDSFLKNENGTAYCLVRPQDNMSLEDKFMEKLHYYFGSKYDKYIGNRIIIVNADITQNNLGLTDKKLEDIVNNITCIINCAAKVSHFGNYNAYKKVNVNAVENLLKICLKFNKRFYQISTVSVSGNMLLEQSHVTQEFDHDIFFRENNLYVDQSLDNVYVRSKFEAEKLILEYVLKGIDAYILRVGNLMNRYSDSKFQPNANENAYIGRLASFLNIGCMPDYLKNNYLEFTPIDICADSVIKLIQYPTKENRIFHLFNHNHVDVTDAIKIIKDYMQFDVIPNDVFINRIDKLLLEENSNSLLAGLLRDFDDNKNLVYQSRVKLRSEFTIDYLQKIGFIWPKISENYLRKFLEYFHSLGFINWEE